MSTNVDGLVSGLDTTSLIKSLLQAERQPQVRLQAKRTEAQKVIDVYQQLNTRLNALETATESLNSALDWRVAKATTSNEAVATASVATSAPASAISFAVTTLARTHAMASASMAVDPAVDVVTTGPITIGAVTITDVGSGTLDDVAAAINAAGAGVTASVVQTGPGTYRLHLSASSSGAAAAFTAGGTLGSLGAFSVVTQGTDASITVGDGPGAYTITSSTNTFTGVIPGATVTVHSVGSATITTSADETKLADTVEAMVKAYNDAVGYIRSNSTYDVATKKAGPLLADSATSRLQQKLYEGLVSMTGSTTGVGLSVGRDGTVTFDREDFVAAFQADPDAVVAAFSANATGTADDGIAERLRLVASSATDSVSGAITNAIESRKTIIKDWDRQISAWDDRLSLREAALRKQFSNLETMLGKLRNQSSWLAGQVASLPVSQ